MRIIFEFFFLLIKDLQLLISQSETTSSLTSAEQVTLGENQYNFNASLMVVFAFDLKNRHLV